LSLCLDIGAKNIKPVFQKKALPASRPMNIQITMSGRGEKGAPLPPQQDGFAQSDGGRKAAGFKGSARDCVTRSIAIASGLPYAEIYRALAKGMGQQRKSKGATARNGVTTSRKWFKDFMASIGFVWTPTMKVGQGCKVHLRADELPRGRLVVSVSRHYTAVIDGVIHDNHDPRERAGKQRCVYGYGTFTGAAA
jgi:hypothetical protein